VSALLELSGLGKRFPTGRGQLHAVDGVDLAVEPGESLGIIGESGSGKSTLARLAARLLAPSAGTIRYDGRDIGAIAPAAFGRDPARREIQFVFQNAGDALNPSFSARRNIAIGLGDIRLRTTAEAVEAVAHEVGLPLALLDKRPHQLSGGQQARVGLARALVTRPRLLILDEPTAALDVSVQATVLKLIDGLRRTRGLTVLFVSHDLEVVRLMCDRVAVLYLGRLAEVGTVEEVLSRPGHPYTRALVAAAPRQGRPKALPGEPISPIDPPQACLFSSRCPFAIDRCRSERPVLRPLRSDQRVACHRSDELSGFAAC
jgi:oligopeptide/dipeptide ABC transporter ATP-binding protein